MTLLTDFDDYDTVSGGGHNVDALRALLTVCAEFL
jgi:hypothetical protein